MFCLPFHASLVLLPPAIAASYLMSVRSHRLPPLFTIASSYAVYLGTLITSVILYRLSPFHPLYRYPGPVWWRTSMLWHAVHTITGQQMRHLKAMHERHGDIIRIGSCIDVMSVSALWLLTSCLRAEYSVRTRRLPGRTTSRGFWRAQKCL